MRVSGGGTSDLELECLDASDISHQCFAAPQRLDRLGYLPEGPPVAEDRKSDRAGRARLTRHIAKRRGRSQRVELPVQLVDDMGKTVLRRGGEERSTDPVFFFKKH